jgi:hypothetical protein
MHCANSPNAITLSLRPALRSARVNTVLNPGVCRDDTCQVVINLLDEQVPMQ